jgi:hypothetical protein
MSLSHKTFKRAWLLCLLVVGCGDDKSESGTAEPASCIDYVMNEVKQCGGEEDADFWIMECERMRSRYEPVGCGKELAEFTRCYSQAEIDCETGYPRDCPDSAIYLACNSRFLQETGCMRTERLDESCEKGNFGFNCFDGLPSACKKLGDASLGVDACCPPFGDQTKYFAD